MAKPASSDFTFGARSKYNWDAWFDGKVWELVEGEDYTNPVAARAAAYAAAKARGLVVRVSLKDTSLFVQVTGAAPVVAE